jgi:hypothetical protein
MESIIERALKLYNIRKVLGSPQTGLLKERVTRSSTKSKWQSNTPSEGIHEVLGISL